jgi:serine/threonine protein kinase
MPWPTPQDYQEAMQNPRLAFGDSDLQSGRAEEDQLGLPRPISGGFASVYKVVIGPARVWAVRCFLKEFQDQQQRYTSISAQLTRAKLPFTVGFNFLTQGIRVRGSWYPVLKMEWVQGESLIRYVSNNLLASQRLLSLGLEVVQMARALHDAGIAHGDLQHGNILVVNGKPKLIDYDGMYVPALQNWGSHEVGHPNYQHPARKDYDFGPGLDNFSVWVIYLSLLALSVRPDLWRQFQGGDDCLLFRRKDFERPDRSPVLRELERLPDARIQALATMFHSLLPLRPLQIPLIDTRPPAQARQSGPTSGVDWLKDHAPARRATPAVGSASPPIDTGGPEPAVIDASWILDNWQEQDQNLPAPSFQNSLLPERLILLGTAYLLVCCSIALILAVTQIVVVLAAWVVITVIFLLANLGYWKYRYAIDGGFASIRALRQQVHNLQQGIRKAQRDIEVAERDRRAELERMGKNEARIQRQLNDIPTEEQRLISEANQRASTSLDEVRRLRTATHDNETQELRRLQKDVDQAVTDIDRRIVGLNQAEKSERDIALRRKQEQHLRTRLQSALLSSADISGIGPKLRERLIQAGYRTAADINQGVFGVVRQIGSRRGSDLLSWRRSVEYEARATEPTTLPPDEVAGIRTRYDQQRVSLQAQRGGELQRLKDSEWGIREKHRRELENLDRREAAIQADLRHDLEVIRDQQSSRRVQLERNLTSLAQERKTSRLLSDLARKSAENCQRLAGLIWEKARLTKQVTSMSARFTFCNYARSIFWGK